MAEEKIGINGARQYADQWAQMYGRQSSSDYWNSHAFLRDNMLEFTPSAGWQQMAQKECYNNSAIQSLAAGLDVVDGFVSACGILVRHAWNADGDKALDFTIEDCEKREYFGVRFPAKVAAKIINSREWPGSEGLIGAIQRMKPQRRDRLLREAGFMSA